MQMLRKQVEGFLNDPTNLNAQLSRIGCFFGCSINQFTLGVPFAAIGSCSWSPGQDACNLHMSGRVLRKAFFVGLVDPHAQAVKL